MNILHISRTMGQGGAEKIVYQLAVGMKEKGWNISVASSGGVYVEKLRRHGISHYILDDMEEKNPVVILRNIYRISKIIKSEKPDVIHTHHRMAALYARILKIFYPKLQLVYTAHNVFENKKLLTKISLSETMIAAVGKGVKQNLMGFFGVDEKSIRIIYNAVNMESIEEKDKNRELLELKAQGKILLAAVGRLSEQKGMDVFLKTFARVEKNLPEVRGIIIGDGELREELEQLAEKLGISGKVLFLGYQEHIAVLLDQIDLLVMPSRWEGLPLTPIEVFAVQKTLVASNISGINEIVKNEENGLLVPKDDDEAFGEAVIRLLADSEMKRRLEKNGKKDYERFYHYETFLEAYEAFYRSVKNTKGDCIHER